ncbi:hypothetical protein HDU87_006333 [Geranomyces variabilis]|uniref:Nitrate reductase [NADPH] n=1 Tax=Geranomyces variabilis TaxID=109894 RepID=A0AAD5TFI7_9FUNG|nr:hypothetical protein HDU87_006333 [Geranomyces variabilis]
MFVRNFPRNAPPLQRQLLPPVGLRPRSSFLLASSSSFSASTHSATTISRPIISSCCLTTTTARHAIQSYAARALRPPALARSTRSSSTSSRATTGKFGSARLPLAALAAAVLLSAVLAARSGHVHAESSKSEATVLPTYTRAEVATHTTPETGIWVTCGSGVYDITNFVEIHPGGSRILQAAGRSIDPFWAVFAIHQSPETRQLLETYRIGHLAPARTPEEKAANAAADARDKEALQGLFANDPKRDPRLVTLAACPCNAETPPAELTASITPTPVFFVRNHLPVPAVDVETYRLRVDGPTFPQEVELSLADLRALPKHTVTVTLQCAGNRRKDMHEVKATKGLQWTAGGISTATWSGALLTDVLRAAHPGFDLDNQGSADDDDDDENNNNNIAHVHFRGVEGYGASIPFHKAASPAGEVLVAYEMNGEPLPPDHGAPLRAVVPGHVAARSVKWLESVVLSDEESESHWQRRDYKGFCPSTEMPTEEDYDSATSIQELPINSAVLSPRPDSTVEAGPDGKLAVLGYAVSGGGRAVLRVDVSADGGRSWVAADLKPAAPRARPGRQWAWTHFEARVPVAAAAAAAAARKDGQVVEVVCKAVDEAYNSQPERVEGIWNMRGVLSNAWHRVKVTVTQPGAAEEKPEEGGLVERIGR